MVRNFDSADNLASDLAELGAMQGISHKVRDVQNYLTVVQSGTVGANTSITLPLNLTTVADAANMGVKC